MLAAAGFWVALALADVNPGTTLQITGTNTTSWTWQSPYYLNDVCPTNPGPATYPRAYYTVSGLYDPNSQQWQYQDVPNGTGYVTAACVQTSGPTYDYGTGQYDYAGTNTYTASASYSIPSNATPGTAYKTALLFDCNNPSYCTVGASAVDIVAAPASTTTVNNTTTVGSTTTVGQTTTVGSTTTVAQTTTVQPPVSTAPEHTTTPTPVRNQRPTLAWLSFSELRHRVALRVRICDDSAGGLMQLRITGTAPRVRRSLLRVYPEAKGCRVARVAWEVPKTFARRGFVLRARVYDREGAASSTVTIHVRRWER